MKLMYMHTANTKIGTFCPGWRSFPIESDRVILARYLLEDTRHGQLVLDIPYRVAPDGLFARALPWLVQLLAFLRGLDVYDVDGAYTCTWTRMEATTLHIRSRTFMRMHSPGGHS